MEKEKIYFFFQMVIFHLFGIPFLLERVFFEVSELDSFRKLNTRLQGHPTTHEGLPGIRIASGSLGQGHLLLLVRLLVKS